MSGWKGRRVFVTGATGLLGSWLTEELLGRGATVTTLPLGALMDRWPVDAARVLPLLVADGVTWLGLRYGALTPARSANRATLSRPAMG